MRSCGIIIAAQVLTLSAPMEILTVEFEHTLIIHLSNQPPVKLVPFLTGEQGNIKFGITAPRSVRVNREEVQALLKEKKMALIEE